MNSATFRSLREYLGLPGSWCADQLDVSTRTVRKWDQGEAPIPARVSAWLEDQVEIAADAVNNITTDLALHPDGQRVYFIPQGGPIHHGRPIDWWRNIGARVLQADSDVRLEWRSCAGSIEGLERHLRAIVTLRQGDRTATVHGIAISEPTPYDLDSDDMEDQLREGETPKARARLGAWFTALAHLDANEWPQIPEGGNWGSDVEIRYEPTDIADLRWDDAWTMARLADVSGWVEGWVEYS